MEEKPPSERRAAPRARSARPAFSAPDQAEPDEQTPARPLRRAAKAAPAVTFQAPSAEDHHPRSRTRQSTDPAEQTATRGPRRAKPPTPPAEIPAQSRGDHPEAAPRQDGPAATPSEPAAPEPARTAASSQRPPRPAKKAAAKKATKARPEPTPAKKATEAQPEPTPSKKATEAQPEPTPAKKATEAQPEPTPAKKATNARPESAPKEAARAQPEPAPTKKATSKKTTSAKKAAAKPTPAPAKRTPVKKGTPAKKAMGKTTPAPVETAHTIPVEAAAAPSDVAAPPHTAPESGRGESSPKPATVQAAAGEAEPTTAEATTAELATAGAAPTNAEHARVGTTAAEPRPATAEAAPAKPGPATAEAAPAEAAQPPTSTAEPAPTELPRRSERTEPWVKLLADPRHAPELLALAAVQTVGPRARDWADRIRAAYPAAQDHAIARLATSQFTRAGSLTSIAGAVAGSYAPAALLGTAAIAHAQLILHLAAAYGKDPTDPKRAAELLVIVGVHPTVEDAEAALTVAGRPAHADGGLRRLGRMIVGQTSAWTAVRLLNRYFPGTSLLAAFVTGNAATQAVAARANAYYRKAVKAR